MKILWKIWIARSPVDVQATFNSFLPKHEFLTRSRAKKIFCEETSLKRAHSLFDELKSAVEIKPTNDNTWTHVTKTGLRKVQAS